MTMPPALSGVIRIGFQVSRPCRCRTPGARQTNWRNPFKGAYLRAVIGVVLIAITHVSSVEDNSETPGEFMDPLNCQSGVFTLKLAFSGRLGAIRRWHCCSHHEVLKA